MYKTENSFSLIRNWHSKASEEDYFSKYIFEYMAFMTFLRTQWLTEKELKKVVGNDNNATDRDYIQILKRDSYINDYWKNIVLKSSKNIWLVQTLRSLTDFLNNEPMKSDKRWWNFCGCDFNLRGRREKISGILNNKNDFQNLVEFWYSIRNNLFHGNKDPLSEKDKNLVKFAFLTLNFFVENVLLKIKELKSIYPSIWESFWYRLKNGELEIATNNVSRDSVLIEDIYCFAFLNSNHYPIVLFDKIFTRSEIIKMIKDELVNEGKNSVKYFSKLKYLAGISKQEDNFNKYFKDTMGFISRKYNLKISLK